MSAEDYFVQLRQEIAGRSVRYLRMDDAALILYIDCQPGGSHGWAIRIEPPWQLTDGERVRAGSGQANVRGGDGATETTIDKIRVRILNILDAEVAWIGVDSPTNELHLQLGNNFEIRTFVSDPDASCFWEIADLETGMALRGRSEGFDIHDLERAE